MKQNETKSGKVQLHKYAAFSGVLKKLLKLDNSPIAIAFSNVAPKAVEQRKGVKRLCGMLDSVRFDGEIFYTTVENHECDGGSGSCGMKEMSERIKTGEFLCKMGLFGSPRAARRFINANPRIETGTVKIVSFSPLEKLIFEPDVVAIICNAKQAMILLEAYAYENGKRAMGMAGPPICSSIVAAPYLTGEVTYSFGDHGARNYMRIKDDEVFIGIPAELMSTIMDNLGKLKF